ncbi:GNAT family N-acetyltransferase [Vibrio plantisponsor]|uniref:GNAT family N-acetyltransferase n=1 Tax=Vibrio plantisponsor TaxID=664643 RepID=A0ABU4IQJ9_9VIBR|nr:GNAT family N-acetyltransferase [Vibrio plantisponsor]MDW6020132.1 GNAT family N-acetyltransferase [Vibrio plantisponsor]NNM40965.1 GNAT family N-acetyltransferase [Vibrio plantisponsor]
MKIVCETARLVIRHFELRDAEFIVRLLNEEAFIRCIGDKKVRTKKDAIDYLSNGPMLSYKVNGFGLNMVELKDTHTPIGMCGILKRPELDSPDLGYAFLSQYHSNGYAREAASAVMKAELPANKIEKVYAVTFLDNDTSNRLLKDVGFQLTGTRMLYGLENNLYEHR